MSACADRIKNTTGYSINALADFAPEEPIEILKRIMIGSEGTLGFVSRVTYNTVVEHPHKASAFLIFPDITDACNATSVLRSKTAVDAVEIFDRRSLKLCQEMGRMAELCPEIANLPAGGEGAALLIECRGADRGALDASIAEVCAALQTSSVPVNNASGYTAESFLSDPAEYNVFWDARKGLIPIVGGAREGGSSMLLEVCFRKKKQSFFLEKKKANRRSWAHTCPFSPIWHTSPFLPDIGV